MPTNEGFSGVSNCYVFKSRLQEYAQKVGLPTPVYETTKEGPSHEPCFRSTVIVNDVRYDSLPGFFNRKAAEQSAAEVALLELVKCGEVNQRISQPVHETGLCKNLLQEYAQKMNYAIPLYQCRKDEAPGKVHFTCTVEIGGIRYIGAAAKTKKEAEIKAARTALLAIQELSGKSAGNSQLTVIPCRKRGAVEISNNAEETVKVAKAKKCRFKKKMLKKKHSGGRMEHTQVQNTGNLVNIHTDHSGSKTDQTNTSGFQLVRTELLATEATMNCQEGRSDVEPIGREISFVNDTLSHCFGGETGDSRVHSAAAYCNRTRNKSPDIDTSSVPFGLTTALSKKVNDATPDVSAYSVPYEPTTALGRELNKAASEAGTSSVSYEPTTASTKEVNEATGVMETALMVNSSTTTLAKESNEATPDVGTSSMSYERMTPSTKEVSKTTGVMEVDSMMNSSTAALAKESNEVTPDLGAYSKPYEPTTALTNEMKGTTGVMEATSLMNSSILSQMESSSCVIPGVNQPEERVQAGTSQA